MAVSTLLRKCKILATRLHHQPLDEWVENELNGYPDIHSLPTYRKQHSEAYGTFFGPFGAQMRNVAIPMMRVNQKDWETLFTLFFSEGVAYYEALAKSERETLQAPWPADYLAFYSNRIADGGYVCVEAWRPVTRGTIQGMLDQVRNRILSFALKVEAENPEAGEASASREPPIEPAKVDQIFNTYVLGDSNVIATGSGSSTVNLVQMQGDLDGLVKMLRDFGVPNEDVETLRVALVADAEEETGDLPGPAVQRWLGSIMSRIAKGSLILASNATGSAIATLLLQFLGVTK